MQSDRKKHICFCNFLVSDFFSFCLLLCLALPQKRLQNRSPRRLKTFPKDCSNSVEFWKCFRGRFGPILDPPMASSSRASRRPQGLQKRLLRPLASLEASRIDFGSFSDLSGLDFGPSSDSHEASSSRATRHPCHLSDLFSTLWLGYK